MRQRRHSFREGLHFLAQSLRHVFCEFIPEGEHAAFFVFKGIRDGAQFIRDTLLGDGDLELLRWDADAFDALVGAVLQECDCGALAGDELMAVGVCGGISFPEVTFRVGHHDAS